MDIQRERPPVTFDNVHIPLKTALRWVVKATKISFTSGTVIGFVGGAASMLLVISLLN